MPECVVCPGCKLPLIQEGRVLCCERCGARCVHEEGIYDFLGDCGPYRGEIVFEEMEQVLQCARLKGWRTAAQEIGFKHTSLNAYVLNNRRMDWLFHCLDFSRTKSCLDLSSDWGTLTFGLADYYDEVWSLEADRQRIAFQRIRQEQDRIDNVRLVRCDWLCLPFPDSHFDLVVANGVLAWIGVGDYSVNPRELQLDFLKEVRRVLKPGGCLYIGTENRLGLPFLRRDEDHSGLPLSSLRARRVGDLELKLLGRGGKCHKWNQMERTVGHRSYTYSFWGYNKILKEAGFNDVATYWTLSYNNPRYGGRFDGESFAYLLRLFKKNTHGGTTLKSLLTLIGARLPRWVIKLGLPFVCPSFLIFAYNGDRNSSFESKLLQSEAQRSSFVRISGSGGVGAKVSYFLLEKGEPCSVLKFARFTASVSAVATEEARMSRFNQMDIGERVVDVVTVFVEPPIRGVQPEPHSLSHNQKVLSWLLGFQHKTQRGYWSFDQLEAKIAVLDGFISDVPIGTGVRSRTRQRMELFAKSLQRVTLPITAEHGDFSSANILIGDDGQVYVTDWEFYQADSEPLFDFLFFILGNAGKRVGHGSFQDNFLNKGRYSPILWMLMSQFAKTRGLPPELVLQAVPYALLRCLHRTSNWADDKHANFMSYMKLLEAWDEVCLSTAFHMCSDP